MDNLSGYERRLWNALMGSPIIGNTHRGLLVEAMMAEALGSDWRWTGADWFSWDFEHCSSKIKMEVKQSAALQPWSHANTVRSLARFDIAKRSGYWERSDTADPPIWHSKEGRAADLYVFAWHGSDCRSLADQRNPDQWIFFVTNADDLPDKKSIGLKWLEQFTKPCQIDALKTNLEQCLSIARRQR